MIPNTVYMAFLSKVSKYSIVLRIKNAIELIIP